MHPEKESLNGLRIKLSSLEYEVKSKMIKWQGTLTTIGINDNIFKHRKLMKICSNIGN